MTQNSRNYQPQTQQKSKELFHHLIFTDETMIALLILDFNKESHFPRHLHKVGTILFSKNKTKTYSKYPMLSISNSSFTSSIGCFSMMALSMDSASLTLGLT